MVLNSRVGTDQLASKLAQVFGVKYTPPVKSKTINDKKLKPSQRSRKLYLTPNILNTRLPKECIDFLLFILVSWNYHTSLQTCVNDAELVEEIEYQNEVVCKHVYEKKCHTSFVTKYHEAQIEKCDVDFRKECNIVLEPVAENVTQIVCHQPVSVENCEKSDNIINRKEECRTVHETQCETDFMSHPVIKFN